MTCRSWPKRRYNRKLVPDKSRTRFSANTHNCFQHLTHHDPQRAMGRLPCPSRHLAKRRAQVVTDRDMRGHSHTLQAKVPLPTRRKAGMEQSQMLPWPSQTPVAAAPAAAEPAHQEDSLLPDQFWPP